jgi:hypothetical protein
MDNGPALPGCHWATKEDVIPSYYTLCNDVDHNAQTRPSPEGERLQIAMPSSQTILLDVELSKGINRGRKKQLGQKGNN